MAKSQPSPDPDGVWPSCEDQRPGVSIRPLRHADLAALLAHLDLDHDRQPQRGAASRRQSIDRHQQDQPPTRTERAVPPGRPGPERAAG